jgi:hypothetical protein
MRGSQTLLEGPLRQRAAACSLLTRGFCQARAPSRALAAGQAAGRSIARGGSAARTRLGGDR